MTRARGRLAALAATVAVLAATVGGPAQAAPNQYARSIGTATGTVQTASVAVPPVVRSSAPCPDGTTVVNGFLNSTAAGLVDAIAISANTADVPGLSTTGMPLADNLLGIAQNAGRVLVNGRYDLSVVCYPDSFGTPPTGQFDASFTISGGATPTSAGTTVTWDVAGSTITSTALTITPAGSASAGADVTLRAVVSRAAGTGAVPGAIQFSDVVAGTPVPIGGPVTMADGAASLVTRDLAAGTHTITATFVPASAAFLASTSAPVPYQILVAGQQRTTTTLTITPPGPVQAGSTVTLSAGIDPAGAAGTVTFADGGAPLGEATVTGGIASLTLQPAVAGALSITATFVPADPALFAGSVSAAVPLTVTTAGGGGQYLGDLTVEPETGDLATSIRLAASSRPCPVGATEFSVRLQGPGGWAGGVPVAANGDLSVVGSSITLEALGQVAGQNGLQIVPGAYQFVVSCQVPFTENSAGILIARIWFYDATHWLDDDPRKIGIPTTVTLALTPNGRADVGAELLIVATVTPADVTGKVVFSGEFNGASEVIGEATVKDGTARLRTKTLEFGLHYVTGAMEPVSEGQLYRPSTSVESPFVVTKIVPPVPTRDAAVTGRPVVGSTLTCAAGFTGATGRTFVWLANDAVVIGPSSATHRVVAAERGKSLRCIAYATNAGGRTERRSPAVRVTG